MVKVYATLKGTMENCTTSSAFVKLEFSKLAGTPTKKQCTLHVFHLSLSEIGHISHAAICQCFFVGKDPFHWSCSYPPRGVSYASRGNLRVPCHDFSYETPCPAWWSPDASLRSPECLLVVGSRCSFPSSCWKAVRQFLKYDKTREHETTQIFMYIYIIQYLVFSTTPLLLALIMLI